MKEITNIYPKVSVPRRWAVRNAWLRNIYFHYSNMTVLLWRGSFAIYSGAIFVWTKGLAGEGGVGGIRNSRCDSCVRVKKIQRF